MKNNHVNKLFETFKPTEEQKNRILNQLLSQKELLQSQKSAKNEKKYISRRFLRPAIACILALTLLIGYYSFRGEKNSFKVYAYSENLEINETGIQLATGEIHDGGEMKGNLMEMYLDGKNIDHVRFSCKNQIMNFTDRTEKRGNFSLEKQFTVSYGKNFADYKYLVVDWDPVSTIEQLTEGENKTISKLDSELRNDLIVIEVTFLNGDKETKAIELTLKDNGKIFAKLNDYTVGDKDDFILNPQNNFVKKKPIHTFSIEKDYDNKNLKYSKDEIEQAKEVVKKYYDNFKWGDEIISIEYSEDPSLLDGDTPDSDKGWDVITFVTYLKSGADIPRIATLARENSGNSWRVINEGYY